MYPRILIWFLLTLTCAASSAATCGEVHVLTTHENTRTRYTLTRPTEAINAPVTLVLLVGGSGYLNLDDQGCPQAFAGNSLVRMLPLFHQNGFTTVLVDAPSDYTGEDGLAGFRTSPQHAKDIGMIIADVRKQTPSTVWLVGTSRGTLSAVNAASRLADTVAPDGLIITSVLSLGARAKKPWVIQTVFDLPLENIKVPTLIIGHTADNCARSPASQMDKIAQRTASERLQVVTVTGGPFAPGRPSSLDDCEGRAPHGYWEQEEEVAAGMAQFIRGGRYP